MGRELHLYEDDRGRQVFVDDMRALVEKYPGVAAPLRELCRRIAADEPVQRHHRKYLHDSIWEARLTYHGNEFRVFYAEADATNAPARTVVLAIHAIQKTNSGAQTRAIETAIRRLDVHRALPKPPNA